MTTTASRKVHLLRVNQRIYRKVSRRDGRRRFVYVHPELKISNTWLRAAGFSPGDRVAVYAQPGMLVVLPVPKREPAAGATESNRL